MDIEETVEATRWLMKSNWGPDQNTSPAIATGIILGLRARDLTGKGQPVHINMLNANAWTNADEYYDYADRPPIAMPDEEIYGLHALYRLYRCREGWVFLGCLFQDEWETFCRTVQREELLADTRFSTPEARQANDEALIAEISAILAERTAAEWEELLTKADIGCVRADEALEGEFYADHPHARANALSVEVEHPYVGKYPPLRRVGRTVHDPGDLPDIHPDRPAHQAPTSGNRVRRPGDRRPWSARSRAVGGPVGGRRTITTARDGQQPTGGNSHVNDSRPGQTRTGFQ